MSKKKNEKTANTISAGCLLDYVSGKEVKETKKELVRQRIARALIHEYGFSPDDMENDFNVGGRGKVDIGIFHHDTEHELGNLSRVVICRPEPKVGRSAVRIRDFEQAAEDLGDLESVMREVDEVQYGLWTNGLEFFFLEKEGSSRRSVDKNGLKGGHPGSLLSFKAYEELKTGAYPNACDYDTQPLGQTQGFRLRKSVYGDQGGWQE